MAVFKYVLGFIKGRLQKISRNYNIIERTEKLMDSEKHQPAPRHPGTDEKFKYVAKSLPDVNIQEEIAKKSEDLLKNLKSIRVEGSVNVEAKYETKRELPQNRAAYQIPKYGYEEPKLIPTGKCSLRQALEFITNNQNEPQKWTKEVVADKYALKVQDVENVINYFKAFQLLVPKDKKKSAMTDVALTSLGISSTKNMPIYEEQLKVNDDKEPSVKS